MIVTFDILIQFNIIVLFGSDTGLFGSITGAMSGWFQGTGDNTLAL